MTSANIWLWCARVAWALLPLSAGGALGDAIDGWSTPSRRVASVLLWLVWGGGLVALFAPRPWGLTILRVAAPIALACAIASVGSTSAGEAIIAVASALVAFAFACSAPVALASANALAYGDEVRFPLRIPPPLVLGPVPLAIGLVGAGLASGPMLLASGHIALGVVTLPLGLAVAALLARSLHALSRRWLVFVPAGVVVVDPLTLLDPVLIRRTDLASIQRLKGVAARSPFDGIDLRLGTVAGTIALRFHEAQSFPRRRGRRDAEIRAAVGALVSVVRAGEAVARAGARRLPTA